MALFEISTTTPIFAILIINLVSITCKPIDGNDVFNTDKNGSIPSNSVFRADDSETTKNAIVSRINCYRSCHSVPALKRDTQIESSQSDGYAQQLGNSGNLQHSQSDYGENLYAGPNPEDCVDGWYFECNGSYNYGSESFSCGHFTQMVWKASQKIGIGIATMSQYGYVVVANFDPAGNMGGEYAENVLKPEESCVTSCKSGSTSGGQGGGSGGSSETGNGTGGGDGGGTTDGNNGNDETTTMASNNGDGSWPPWGGNGGSGQGNGNGNGGNGMGGNTNGQGGGGTNGDGWWPWGGNGSGGNHGNNGNHHNHNSTTWGNTNHGGNNCGHNNNCDPGGWWWSG